MRQIIIMAALIVLASNVVPQTSGTTFVIVAHPQDTDGDRTTQQKYIDQNIWPKIVIGAWEAFERSGINNVIFVNPYPVAGPHRVFLVRVYLVPGYKPKEKAGCTLADAYRPDTESVIIEHGEIRFYVGCSIDRDEPKKGSPEWMTAMSAILAHEVVHIIAPDCKHDSDSSTIYGESINLLEMDSDAKFSEKVVTECFGRESPV